MNGSLGGKFDVPYADLDTFHEECMTAFQRGVCLYLSERLPSNTLSPFRFFVDIDFDEEVHSEIPSRDHLIDSVVKCVYETVDESESEIVSFRGTYKIHINFPNIIVDKQTVKILYSALLKMVKQTFPKLYSEKKKHETWGVVLDSSVYNSGLRTLVSRKKRSSTPNYYRVYEKKDGAWIQQETSLDLLKKTSLFVKLGTPLSTFISPITNVMAVIQQKPVVDLDNQVQHALFSFYNENFDFRKPFKTPVVNDENHTISFPMTEKYCYFEQREHRSNNCYVLLDHRGTRFRCHDPDCKGKEAKIVEMEKLPSQVQDFWRDAFEKVKGDHDLKTSATKDCKDNIKYFYPKSSDSLSVREMENMFVSEQDQDFGFCQQCKEYSNVFETYESGWCLRCTTCDATFPPRNGLIPIPPIFGSLKQYFMKINLTLVNNTTIVNNYGNDQYTGAWDKEPLQVFQDDTTNEYFKLALSGNDNSIAKLMVKLYGHLYHGSVTPLERWFRFEGHSWVEGVEAYYALKKKVSDPEFLGYFKQAVFYYQNQNIQDDQTKKKIKHLENVLENLQSNTMRTTILKDAIGEFYFTRQNFAENLNTKNYMAFANGIYDFDKMIFRDGSPDDCLTMKSPCKYIPFDENSEDIKKVFQFLRDILPDPSVLDYVLKILGLCLTTDTSQQYFFIFTGSGSNGKSKIMSLLENCLGDYHGTASPELITTKREKANQANESLASLEKSRVLIISEAAKKDVIQANLLKVFTGEDTITTRHNYGSQMKFKPKFKVLFICNDIPKVTENGPAVWRRIKIINFPCSFVDNPADGKPFEKQKNEELTRSILEDCQDAFVSILVEYHRLYRESGLQEPESVTMSTSNYKKQNAGPIPEYLVGSLVEEVMSDESGTVFCVLKAKDLQDKLQTWAEENLDEIPKPSVLKQEMGRFFGCEPDSCRVSKFIIPKTDRVHGWKNYRFKEIEDIESDSEES